MRLQCSKDTPVKVLTPVDLTDDKVDSVLHQLQCYDRVVVIMPDRQDVGVWQMLWFFTQRRYFYRPHTRLLGVEGLSHWALLVDFNKMKDGKKQDDELIKPEREYGAEELEGKFQLTRSAKRRYRKRLFESDPGYMPRQK